MYKVNVYEGNELKFEYILNNRVAVDTFISSMKLGHGPKYIYTVEKIDASLSDS